MNTEDKVWLAVCIFCCFITWGITSSIYETRECKQKGGAIINNECVKVEFIK